MIQKNEIQRYTRRDGCVKNKPFGLPYSVQAFNLGFLTVSSVSVLICLDIYFSEQAHPLHAAGFGASVFGQ